MVNISWRLIVIVMLSALLGACSDSGGGSGDGTLSVAITDAPVDGVTEVTVEFSGITVNPRNGPHLEFPFNEPKSIDLAALDRGNTAELLNNQSLPAGEYNWIRLDVNADCDDVYDSFVEPNGGGMVELRVPSARGLQLGNGFVITANENTSFVIDWDLRKGLNDPQGSDCFKLRPTLRIIDSTEHGTIAGTVDAALVNDMACTSDPDTGAGNVVYIYEGGSIMPDDIDGADPDPVSTANVQLNGETGDYEYVAAFLSPGEYTAAFTCQGQGDNVPDEDNPQLNVDDPIAFGPVVNDVVVVNGQTTAVDF